MLSAAPEIEADTWPTIGYGTLPLRKILVVQTQRMGDVLCATPVFAALRRRFPRARIGALVHRPWDDLLRGSPDLDEVISYDRLTTHRTLASRLRFIGELKEREYDWALSIHAASSVAFAMWQAAVKWRTCVWRYGERKKPHWSRMFHQHVRQDRVDGKAHEIEYNLDVLRQLQIEPEPSAYRVHLSEAERAGAAELLRARGRDESRPLAVVHPGHGGGRQVWPSSDYAAVGDGLARRGWQVGVTGSSGERELVRSVTSSMQEPSLDLAGGMDLRTFAAVLSHAGLMVSIPTGPMHLASASGVPVVALYGPTDLRVDRTRFYPYGGPYEAIVSAVDCTCRSSHHCVEAVCMRGITPEAVVHAAARLTNGVRGDLIPLA
jgi:ADP-heptose:LPS heptosyltransferase